MCVYVYVRIWIYMDRQGQSTTVREQDPMHRGRTHVSSRSKTSSVGRPTARFSCRRLGYKYNMAG